MLFEVVLVLAGFFGILRLNAKLERRLMARRTLHGLIKPLSSYLGLLDHEMQNETGAPDNLVAQAVLDHVTELRAFLLQPPSKDLVLWGKWPWLIRLNNILLGLEESLEGALEESWTDHYAEVKEQVVHLHFFIKENPLLRRLSHQQVGILSI